MSTWARITKAISKPRTLVTFLAKRGCFNFLSDSSYLRLVFYASTGRALNLKNPTTYNEKIQWLKLHDRRPEQAICVDKYLVREYIKATIGEEYLVPLLGVYDSFEEIDFNLLPDQFVLKCTHDSGGLVICRNKKELDFRDTSRKIKRCLSRDFFYYGREWPYKGARPRIICEKYLQENITDYKIMCFHGEPKLIQVHKDRGLASHTLDFYDATWNRTPIRRNTAISPYELEQPVHFEEMLEIARRLSSGEIHVRVDLYEVDGKVYFGEKTYYSACGFATFASDEYDELLGSWIELPTTEGD